MIVHNLLTNISFNPYNNILESYNYCPVLVIKSLPLNR